MLEDQNVVEQARDGACPVLVAPAQEDYLAKLTAVGEERVMVKSTPRPWGLGDLLCWFGWHSRPRFIGIISTESFRGLCRRCGM